MTLNDAIQSWIQEAITLGMFSQRMEETETIPDPRLLELQLHSLLQGLSPDLSNSPLRQPLYIRARSLRDSWQRVMGTLGELELVPHKTAPLLRAPVLTDIEKKLPATPDWQLGPWEQHLWSDNSETVLRLGSAGHCQVMSNGWWVFYSTHDPGDGAPRAYAELPGLGRTELWRTAMAPTKQPPRSLEQGMVEADQVLQELGIMLRSESTRELG